MIIYFIVYMLTFIFAYLAERNHEKNIYIFYLMALLAILIPSIFAGLRNSGIGTDTQVYIDQLLNLSSKFNKFSDFYSYMNDIKLYIEPLFLLITFISTKIVNSINFGYFFIQLFIMFFAFLACYRAQKINNNISMSLAYLSFMFLLYNKTFNLCRQSFAIVIMMSAVKFILERNWKKYFLYLLLAIGFHDTAIICLPLYFIYPIIKNKNVLLEISILFAILIIVIAYKPLLQFLISHSFMDYSYNYVLNIKGNSIVISAYLIFIALVIFFNLYKKTLNKLSDYNSFYIYIITVAAIIYCIGFSSKYSQRISFYFIYYIIFLIPQMKYFIKLGKNKILINFFIIIFLGIFSWWYYDHAQTDNTVPYESKILSINNYG